MALDVRIRFGRAVRCVREVVWLRYDVFPGNQVSFETCKLWLSLAAIYWRYGLWTALLHALVLCVVAGLIIELSLLTFRKIPFTCSSPPFRSNSPVLAFAWVMGILLMAIYTPQAEIIAVHFPWLCFLLAIPAVAVFVCLRKFRKGMLAMDKTIIFEEPEDNLF